MKNVILAKADSLLLATISIIYGWQLVSSAELVERYEVYRLLTEFTTATIVGLLFLFWGVIKLIGIMINNGIIKRVSLLSLSFLWTVLWVLFVLSSVNNTINLLPLSMAVLSFIIARREVY